MCVCIMLGAALEDDVIYSMPDIQGFNIVKHV